MDHQLAESMYYKEEERKRELLSLLNFVLAILGICMGLFAFYMVTFMNEIEGATYNSPIENLAYWVLRICLCLDFISIAATIGFILYAFHNHEYKYLEKPSVLREYYNKLLAHNKGVDEETALENTNKKFKQYLFNTYLESADWNDGKNQKRKMAIHRSTRCVIFAIIFLVVTFIPFYFAPRTDSANIEPLPDTYVHVYNLII